MNTTRSSTRALCASFAFAIVSTLIPDRGADLAAQAAPVTVKDAWVRAAPTGRTVTAVFLVAENSGATARSIVSGATAVADTLELHEMKRDGDMMQMSPVKSITVPAHGQVDLKPGGLHLMLFGLKKPLAAGDTVKLTLTLDDGSRIAVAAPVRQPGGMP